MMNSSIDRFLRLKLRRSMSLEQKIRVDKENLREKWKFHQENVSSFRRRRISRKTREFRWENDKFVKALGEACFVAKRWNERRKSIYFNVLITFYDGVGRR